MPLANETRMTKTKRMASTGLSGVVVEAVEVISDMLRPERYS
jgi:hypothetical protein